MTTPSIPLTLEVNVSSSYARLMTSPSLAPTKPWPNESMISLAKAFNFLLSHPSPFTYLGLMDDFNGVDVQQYDDSIVLSSHKYIDCVLQTHGWETPTAAEYDSKHPTPMSIDAIDSMYKHVGPAEGTPAHAALAAKHGFSYRTLLGELLYAYVTCRPDIGYATITLSKFSICPQTCSGIWLYAPLQECHTSSS